MQLCQMWESALECEVRLQESFDQSLGRPENRAGGARL